MEQMTLSTKQKQITAKESRPVVPGGRVGSSGFLGANCYIWNGWKVGRYSTEHGTMCDWVNLLYKRN